MNHLLWPIQQNGLRLTLDAIARGVLRILLASPTGTGKSRLVCALIERLVAEGWCVILFTNRRLLIEQLQGVLDGQGIDYGVRAAGHDAEEGRFWPVQISSLPTEASRVLRKGTWEIHGAGKRCLAIVDEAHLNDGAQARAVIAKHLEAGHVVLGVTATPLDIGQSYDELLVAGNVTDGRNCGALVPAVHYGPDEPDIKSLKGKKPAEGEDLTAGQQKKLYPMTGALFGRVWDNFEQLNPEHKPFILFAPGVQESLWFAEQFTKRGVPTAHIDGEDIWIGGDLTASSPEARKRLVAMSRSGEIRGITNRFVLREGIDLPWVRHVVAATVFGSLQSYLQALGRGLRADQYEDTTTLWGIKEHVTIQDHGGNWWRHGSLNADRDWFLDQTGVMAYGLRADGLRKSREQQPFRCPQCGRIWPGPGKRCSPAIGGCGYVLENCKRSRPVVTAEGTLRQMGGDVFGQRRPCQQPNGPSLWERMYIRSLTEKGAKTFRQGFALFAYENEWGWPDKSWPLMPADPKDEFRLVADVPLEKLTGDEGVKEKIRLYRERRVSQMNQSTPTPENANVSDRNEEA